LVGLESESQGSPPPSVVEATLQLGVDEDAGVGPGGRKPTVADVGDLFRTGQETPASGVYRFIESADAECEPTPEAMEIPLSKDERFPPHRRCKGAVIWELVRFA
jgi:hypothetical protein